MYIYHEGYCDAYYTGAILEEVRARDRRDDDSTYEPIQMPAILNWLVIMSVALCVIFTTIHILS
jgi:hypothetical protein